MFEIILSKDTSKVLCIIYKEYLSLIKSGKSKSSSLFFSSSKLDNLFPIQDIEFELEELKRNNFITKDITGSIELTTDSIIYMENHKLNTIEKILDYISKFIP